jgi:hypothetical protein
VDFPDRTSDGEHAPLPNNTRVDNEIHLLRRQDAVEQLIQGSVRFQYGITVVHRAGEIGIRKGKPAEWTVAQDLSRRRSAFPSKEETGLRTQIGMAPTVQDNARDIALRIKSRTCKHLSKLIADLPFVVPE